MALTQFTGPGFLYPRIPLINTAPGFDSTLLMDAATDSAAMIGRVWTPNRGSKSIRKIGFLFGAVEKAAGTDVRVSLQDVDLTTGPPGRPDGGVDQSITIDSGDAGYDDNLWYMTGNLSADRSVAYGELLSVVWDFNGTWVSADSTIIRGPTTTAGLSVNNSVHSSLFTGASWAVASAAVPNAIFEFSDGTFGTLMGAFPCSGLGTQVFASNTAGADEFALKFTFPVEVKVDGAWACLAIQGGANFNILLTDATGAAVSGFTTVSVDEDSVSTSNSRYGWFPFSSEVTLAANTTYYLSIQPTTTTSLTLYTFSVSAAAHLDCHEGGQAFCLAGRIDGGAWAAPTLTSRPFIGLSVSSIHAGGGGGPLVGDSRLVRS